MSTHIIITQFKINIIKFYNFNFKKIKYKITFFPQIPYIRFSFPVQICPYRTLKIYHSITIVLGFFQVPNNKKYTKNNRHRGTQLSHRKTTQHWLPGTWSQCLRNRWQRNAIFRLSRELGLPVLELFMNRLLVIVKLILNKSLMKGFII